MQKKKDERLCTLIFDEMSLSPHFEYNRKKDNRISGFVNCAGEVKPKIADYLCARFYDKGDHKKV